MQCPRRLPRAYFLTLILSIAVGVKLIRQLDFLLFEWVMGFWDLTCDFWVENAKNKYTDRNRSEYR